MMNNQHNILTLLSNESDDDELISCIIIKQLVIKPKISNFILNVVHSYSDKLVFTSILISSPHIFKVVGCRVRVVRE